MTGTARIIHGNALDLPLDDSTVDLIVTSPPYYLLRSYADGGQPVDGQIGNEASPDEYVDALLAATREMVRVLKPSGSIWVNLGDKYSRGRRWRGQSDQFRNGAMHTYTDPRYTRNMAPENNGLVEKCLIGLPWRYAIRCIDELGLVLRAEVIWSKPTARESVTDRVRRSHETWFHFVTQRYYYSAVDEIREGYLTSDGPDHADGEGSNTLGKVPGSVWRIPQQGLIVPPELGTDHYAAFPMEWPRRIIKGWSPRDVCTVCDQGLHPVTEVRREARPTSGVVDNFIRSTSIVGWRCDCPEQGTPTTQGVVLDPFGGTGTTALVAKALGRRGISVDLSEDYCRIAEWRTNDGRELAAAAELPPPPKQSVGQLDMFPSLTDGTAPV